MPTKAPDSIRSTAWYALPAAEAIRGGPRGLFNGADVTSGQRPAGTAVGAMILLGGEVIKAIPRARRRPAAAVPA
jgi:hypothetical protein